MKAAPEAQRQVLALQATDNQIAQLRHQAQNLPSHHRAQQLAKVRAGLKDQVIAHETAVSDGEVAVAKAEAEVTPVRERLDRQQARVDSGELAAKALAPMLDEIASLKRRLATVEDAQLAVMEAQEQTIDELDQARQKLADTEQELTEAVAVRDQEMAGLKQDFEALKTTRQAQTETIPADLLALYTKIATRYGGVGAGALVGKKCSACGLVATVGDYSRYMSAPADEVVRCAECDRILVRSTD
jgi:predicted  nucleic acid-binding Zn-ribbon protein